MDEYVPMPTSRIYPVKGNTAQLLNEFNLIYDAVELTHLTPPHTPPQTPLQAYLKESNVRSNEINKTKGDKTNTNSLKK